MTDIVKRETSELMFMSPEVALQVLTGDIERLTPEQRVEFLVGLCHSLNLNPATKPFALIRLNNKLTVYATKDCTEQLRKNNKVSLGIVSNEIKNGIATVVVSAKDSTGRIDEDVGCVNVEGMKGDALANAMMKAITKAKRRATLSLCGLGILDETELETIKDVKPISPSNGFKMIDHSEAVEAITPKVVITPVVMPAAPVAEEPDDPAVRKANLDYIRSEITKPENEQLKILVKDRFGVRGMNALMKLPVSTVEQVAAFIKEEISKHAQVEPDDFDKIMEEASRAFGEEK